MANRGSFFYRATKPVFILDGVTNVDSCWSVHKILSNYTGPCMTLRRSSDNDELDIKFSGQSINVGQALDFIGGGTGFLRRWHSQTGTNHFEQATAANQPPLVFNKAGGYPAVNMNNSGGKVTNMVSASNCPFSGNPDYTLIAIQEYVNPQFQSWGGILGFGTGPSNANDMFWSKRDTSIDEFALACRGGVNVYANPGNAFDPKTLCWIRNSASGANQIQGGNTFVVNSTALTQIRTEQNGALVPNYGASPYFIGHAGGSSNSPPTIFRAANFLSEIIAMTDIKTLGQVQAIQAHQQSRYQLP